MPSLSLAIMVRDDAERIVRAIRSVKESVDEVVVLDTGSKDGTVDAARAEGASVHEVEWPGSFSLGLNTLLDLIKTDWVLRLDSDEWFEVNPKKQLRQAIEDAAFYGYLLIRRDILPEGKTRDISIFRLWRNHPKLRYEGLVHENIGNEGIAEAFPGLAVRESPLWFWHDGYKGGSDDKIKRNVVLLEKEIEERPNQPYYLAMQAAMYKDLGDPRWKPLAEAIIDSRLSGGKGPESRLDAMVFTSVLDDLPDEELTSPRTKSMARFLSEHFPRYPGTLWSIGTLELRRGRLQLSLDAFLELEQLVTRGNYDKTIPANPATLGEGLWHALGFVAQQLGRWDICARAAQNLQARPH